VIVDSSSKTEPLVLHTRVISGSGGGPEKTILNSPRYLHESGYRCICAYLRHPQDTEFQIVRDRAKAKEVHLAEIDDYGIKDFGIVKRLKSFVAADPPAIWHAHDYKTNLLGLMLHRKYPMHLVTTVHGWVQQTWKTPFYYAIDRWCLRRYKRIICVSEDLYESCLKLKVPRERLSHIRNAIALEDYQTNLSSQAAREKLGVPQDVTLVLAVGRLSPEKGFDLLIRAVSELVTEGRSIFLAIAGDGGQYEELKALIESLSMQQHVKLLGFQADPRIAYRAADLYVLSSRREGLPNVVLEAMAMKIPVIATSVAGIPSLIQDGVNGLTIPTESVTALKDSIGRLLSDKSLCNAFAENGYKTILDQYSFKVRMGKVIDVYRSIGV
jgi:glycosyltransferase involved in cell wall biosynthesis